MTPGLLEGQEDCLYINVYRPEEKEDEEEQDQSQELLPVSMIFTKKKLLQSLKKIKIPHFHTFTTRWCT